MLKLLVPLAALALLGVTGLATASQECHDTTQYTYSAVWDDQGNAAYSGSMDHSAGCSEEHGHRDSVDAGGIHVADASATHRTENGSREHEQYDSYQHGDQGGWRGSFLYSEGASDTRGVSAHALDLGGATLADRCEDSWANTGSYGGDSHGAGGSTSTDAYHYGNVHGCTKSATLSTRYGDITASRFEGCEGSFDGRDAYVTDANGTRAQGDGSGTTGCGKVTRASALGQSAALGWGESCDDAFHSTSDSASYAYEGSTDCLQGERLGTSAGPQARLGQQDHNDVACDASGCHGSGDGFYGLRVLWSGSPAGDVDERVPLPVALPVLP